MYFDMPLLPEMLQMIDGTNSLWNAAWGINL